MRILSKALAVRARGETLLDGPLHAPIIPDDSEWQIDDGALVITLVKSEAEQWWERVLQTVRAPAYTAGLWRLLTPCAHEQDTPLDVSKCGADPFMLGEMEDHQHADMQWRVKQMLGLGDSE